MSTHYGKSSEELRAPLANGATRYTGSAALIAAIRAAALAAPEFWPLDSAELRGHYAPGPGRCEELAGPRVPVDTYRSGMHELIEDAAPLELSEDWHGPCLPLPPRFVAFHYTANGTRGRWIAPNVRGADADDSYRRPCGLFGLALKAKSAALAFDGKARKAARPSTPKGSAPHVTARALWAEGDYRGALMVADAIGPVFFGASTPKPGAPSYPPILYMRPERIELAGHAFMVARSAQTGRFHVLHESSACSVDNVKDGAPVKGFATSSAALAWIEERADDESWRARLNMAAAKTAPVDQSAARITLENFGATDPAPEAAEADAAADAPEAAALARSDAPTAEDTGASSAPVLADPGAPEAARAAELRRDGFNPSEAAAILAEDERQADAARSAIVARTVSLADWEARTGERCTGDAGVSAAAGLLGALVGAYPFAARFNLAIELGREGDASARPIVRAVLAAIAAASHLPEAADAARILAALDASAPADAAPRHAMSGGPMPAHGIERADAPTPCYAIPTEAARPPATQSEAAPTAAHAIDSGARSCSSQHDRADAVPITRARAAYLLRAARSRRIGGRIIREALGVYRVTDCALTLRTGRRYRFAAHLIGTDSHRIASRFYACAGAGLTSADVAAADAMLRAMAAERGARVVSSAFGDYAARVWCELAPAGSPPAGNTGANPAPVPPATQSATFRYCLVNRPPMLGALPRGLAYETEARPAAGAPHHAMARHGILIAARELTADECRSFELAPCIDGAAALAPIADACAEALRDYAPAYLAEAADHAEEFAAAVLRHAERGAVRPSIGNPGELVALVLERLRAMVDASREADARHAYCGPFTSATHRAQVQTAKISSYLDDSAERAAAGRGQWSAVVRMRERGAGMAPDVAAWRRRVAAAVRAERAARRSPATQSAPVPAPVDAAETEREARRMLRILAARLTFREDWQAEAAHQRSRFATMPAERLPAYRELVAMLERGALDAPADPIKKAAADAEALAAFESAGFESQMRDALAQSLADCAYMPEFGGAVSFVREDDATRRALASADATGADPFRLTCFDAAGPIGHTGFRTLADACREALARGYLPCDPDGAPPAGDSNDSPPAADSEDAEAMAEELADKRARRRAANRLRDAASALHCGRVYPLAIFADADGPPVIRRNLRMVSIEHTGAAVTFAAEFAGIGSGRAFTADALHVLAAIRRGERETARRSRPAPPSGNTGAVDELAGFELVSSYTGPKCSGASLPDAKAWASTEGKRNPAERFRIVPFTGDRGDAPSGMRAFSGPAPKRTQRYSVERWRAVASPVSPPAGDSDASTGAAESARFLAMAERAESIGNARRAEVARELAADALAPATHSRGPRLFVVLVGREKGPADGQRPIAYPPAEGEAALRTMETLTARGFEPIARTEANGIREDLSTAEMRAIFEYEDEPADPPARHSEAARTVPADRYASDTHERPCAAPGLTSYRARGMFGWVMIGAHDDADALREAERSTTKIHTLERWDGSRYLTCEAFRTFETDRADELKGAPGYTSGGASILQAATARVLARNPDAIVVGKDAPSPWRPASGHRGGWRCWQDTPGGRVSGRQLETADGRRPVLFRSMEAAQARCDELNATPDARVILRPVSGMVGASVTGYPVGGWHALDDAGNVLVRAGYRFGETAPRFKTAAAALKAAPGMFARVFADERPPVIVWPEFAKAYARCKRPAAPAVRMRPGDPRLRIPASLRPVAMLRAGA